MGESDLPIHAALERTGQRKTRPMRSLPLRTVLRLLLPLAVAFLLLAAPVLADDLQGLPVQEIRFESQAGLDQQRFRELLAIKRSEPYEQEKIRQSIERLYATGRFFDIQVEAERNGGGLTLTFIVRENYFVGGVHVDGVPEPPKRGQLVNATKLELGALWTEEKHNRAIEGIKRLLEDNGFYQARIDPRVEKHRDTQQVDLYFDVTPGERARIAEVEITGSPRFPPDQITRAAKLRPGKELTAQRLQSALARLRRFYQKRDYLEAEIGVAERRYLPDKNGVRLVLAVNAGPQVEVRVEGAKLSESKRRELLPIYDEGSVDADLVREGAGNLRDYLQRKGHFEVEVQTQVHEEPGRQKVAVEYHVKPGPAFQVEQVEIVGNRYFAPPTIRERMLITEAGLLSGGRFSRHLLARDVEAIQNLYVANGFPNVRVTPEVLDNYRGKRSDLAARLRVEEGPQTLVRNLTLEGNQQIPTERLLSKVASGDGQPFSSFNVLLDRDTLLTEYFQEGFPEASFTWEMRPVEGRQDRVDLTYKISEGPRQYVNYVLISGLDTTRRRIVDQQVLLRAREPLSQLDMLGTQRHLYDLGIFEKVDMALQNREGKEQHKNVLIQMEEARRYTIAVGGGADIARFGGDTESLEETEGRTGFAPRVSFDVTRLNFRGRNHTLSFKTRVSTLQQRALASYTAPRFWNLPNFTLLFSVFLERGFDVLTFVSQRLEGSVALEQKRQNSDTLLYRYSYRRVQAERNTLKVSVELIPLFARPVRVGMLGASFVRDRRDNPADAQRGMFLTMDTGLSSTRVGSESNFTRFIGQYSTYHRLGPNLVLARSTQFGLAQPFGEPRLVQVLNEEGQPESRLVRDIPLPERFFSGGGNSHRGFGVNQAGPRDPLTGFPLGGGALLLNNVELRFPILGPNIGGALFHDLGNVFPSLGDITFRVRQRDRSDFNYMVHAIGGGIRYRTPIGPVRLDLAWSMNPPAFFGLTGTRQELLAGTGRREPRQLSHFQFFFSIGQTF